MTSARTKRRRAARKSAKAVVVTSGRKIVATRYDVINNTDLVNYWRFVDCRSVDASLDQDTRRRLRERARYEVANNSYAMGVSLAIANAVVGSGARLQAYVDDKNLEKRIEWDFADWADEIKLAEKLRAMRFARFQDGESFAVLHTNMNLSSPVKLDVAPLDAERVASAYGVVAPNDVDGILLDKYGNPVSYRVLTRHPGDSIDLTGRNEFVEDAKIYPASSVIHWYRRTCPEQHRGCPEITASLNLFALLRRYTLAVVIAAETAADFAAVLQTDEANDRAHDECKPLDAFDIERGMVTTMPEGWKVSQLKAEQPVTTFGDFKREILGEIGRSLQIPVNIVAGDSSRYNYASGRLDHQEFQKAIRIDQAHCGLNVMRPIFLAWWREYALINNLQRNAPHTTWYFDGFEHVDPVKEANAQAIKLANFTTTLATEYGKQGRDWEDELIEIAKERDRMAELGLSFSDVRTSLANDEEKENES